MKLKCIKKTKNWSKFNIFFAIIFIFSCENQAIVYNFCPPEVSSPTTINLEPSPVKNVTKKYTSNAGLELSFHPLALPFSIRWNKDKGFFIQGSKEVITPIGTFGLEYNLKSRTKIGSINVTPNDFIVVIVDKEKKKKEVFKIEGYNRLEVVLEGKTKIAAQAGLVEIDASQARVTDLKFYDNSTLKVINSSKNTISYSLKFGVDSSNNFSYYSCSLPSESMITFPIPKNAVPDKYLTINNNDENNDSFKLIEKKFSYGDICEIFLDKENELNIRKIHFD